ncbi:MAG: low molecular weight phosphotyrosine protein phosphatase [Zoogloeaceae bacterium]|nr:low molecular weight phosphotyrosine protein phosphatase [Zoogloeaceae bacterium]
MNAGLPDAPLRVLFVCTGNICRSPTAEGVARRLFAEAGIAERVEFDSAGTHDYHVGEGPDRRACEAAARRGYDLSALRARRIEAADFARFDLVLAMDRDHFAQLQRQCPPQLRDRVVLFMQQAPQTGADEVPDPYYGGEAGFEFVLDLCEAAVRGWLDVLGAKSGSDFRLR